MYKRFGRCCLIKKTDYGNERFALIRATVDGELLYSASVSEPGFCA